MESYRPAFIAFFDILGYKNIVNNNSQDELEKIYNVFNSFKDRGYKIVERSFKNQMPLLKYTYNNTRSIIISDCIIIWSTNYSPVSCLETLALSFSILNSLFMSGLPLRGGITVGDLTEINEQNYISVFGKGLSQAYELENIQEWSGCIVDKKVITEFDRLNSISNSEKNLLLSNAKLIISYNVPLKSGNEEEHYTINWAQPLNVFFENGATNAQFEQIVREIFNKYGKSIESPNIEKKILNTLNFILYCKDLPINL